MLGFEDGSHAASPGEIQQPVLAHDKVLSPGQQLVPLPLSQRAFFDKLPRVALGVDFVANRLDFFTDSFDLVIVENSTGLEPCQKFIDRKRGHDEDAGGGAVTDPKIGEGARVRFGRTEVLRVPAIFRVSQKTRPGVRHARSRLLSPESLVRLTKHGLRANFRRVH